MDDIDRLLCHKFAAFLTQRAEKFMILRRKPVPVQISQTSSSTNLIVGLRYKLSNNR